MYHNCQTAYVITVGDVILDGFYMDLKYYNIKSCSEGELLSRGPLVEQEDAKIPYEAADKGISTLPYLLECYTITGYLLGGWGETARCF